MNLKNPEIFRSWLIKQLKPICKANPEPVSKYVHALLKKEKSDGELKNNLISQLFIFLHSTTEEFVNFLIDALEDEKYLTSDVQFKPSETNDSSKDDEENSEEKVDTASEIVDEKETERKSPSPIQAPTPSPPRKPSQRASSPRSRKNRLRNERRRVAVRKSRRDTSSHSDSPTSERRTVTRKRSASGSSESSTKSPRRSWIASRVSDTKKYKNRNFARSSPGQRSRSTSPKLRKRKPTNGNFRKRPRQNSRSNSEDERIHANKRVSSYQNDKFRELPSIAQDLAAVESSFNKKQRCIDFESKGYCARGDMCPFDHGPSPIVLDNNLLNGIVPLPPVVHSAGFNESNLYTPQYVNPPHFPPKPFRSENPAPVSNRELISVPTLPLPQKTKNVHVGKPSYGHIFSSLPPGVSQTTIELTNVPGEQNTIPILYENFSTFGNLTLIQAKRNGDANTALLTYTNATEAALAFINVDKAMANAKAAWYADKCILKPFPRKSIPASNSKSSTKAAFMLNRTSTVTTSTTATDTNKLTTMKKPCQSPTTPSKVDPATSANLNEKEKVEEICEQDAGRMLSVLIRKKRNLLEKQLASRKTIIEKIKSFEVGSNEEKTWQDMLKKLNHVIAENEGGIKITLQQQREYLAKLSIAPMDSAGLQSIKDQNQMKLNITCNQTKQSLVQRNDYFEDAEQDMAEQLNNNFDADVDSTTFNHDAGEEKSGDEMSAISSSHITNYSKSDENKSPTSVEYTRVVVSGFENGDEEELIQHFSQFGKILDKEIDNTIPSATLIFDNRKSAEEAKRDGRNFQDRLLSVTVYGGKKYVPTLKRKTSFKSQDYLPYNQFGSNPYKYKNPQIANTAVNPRAATSIPNRNVYSYRAEQKSRMMNTKTLPPSTAIGSSISGFTPSDTSSMKLTDDEDLVTFLKKGGCDPKIIEKYTD